MGKKDEALNKAKESWKKIIEWWKEIKNGSSNLLKWTSKSLRHTIKWWYHLIDAWDKAIWEEIEKIQDKKWHKSWKFGKYIRDNTMKLAIALSALGFWWYEVIDSSQTAGWLKGKTEIAIKHVDMSTQEKFISDFFNSSDKLKDLQKSWQEWQDKREARYLWNDEAWNNMRNGFWDAERKKVIEWMCRMIESWHLEMVLKKADEAWVPRQCVFLALAESWWQAWANSWVAWWYWQFTESSAKLFWLIDKDGNDYRTDPEKSTDAAMEHLKENYKIVSNYNKNLWYNMSESDKWIFAFHMYNWSPKLVRKWIVACKWDANKYSEYQDNSENRNYVPRILAIQDALQKIFKENWYDVDKIKAIYLNQSFVKTNADLMHQNYVNDEKYMTKKEKIQKLNEIKAQYTEEYKQNMISKIYYEWAIRIIDDEISSAK